jgi:hypothetical protein
VLDIAVTREHGADAGRATAGSCRDPPRLTFRRVPEPETGKARLHLDIQVDDIGAARRPVEDLDGCWSGERHDYHNGIVMVMRDPETTSSASSSSTTHHRRKRSACVTLTPTLAHPPGGN